MSCEASPSNALLLNKWFGKVQDTDMLHLKLSYAGKDLGELEQGVDPPNWHASLWDELDSFVAPATYVARLLT